METGENKSFFFVRVWRGGHWQAGVRYVSDPRVPQATASKQIELVGYAILLRAVIAKPQKTNQKRFKEGDKTCFSFIPEPVSALTEGNRSH